jgi:hypothetical protein
MTAARYDTEIKFDSAEFLSTGINYRDSSWKLRDLFDLTQYDCVENLAKFAYEFGATENSQVLSCYTGKDGNIWFNLPYVALNEAGNLTLFLDKFSSPVENVDGKFRISGKTFRMSPRRNADRGLIQLRLVTTLSMEIDGILEDQDLVIPIRCTKNADLAEVARSLQSGNKPQEGLFVNTGKPTGGSMRIFYKPWMLEPGIYKIASVQQKNLPSGGRIWEGSLMDRLGAIHWVKMTAAPFVVQKKESLLLAAQRGETVLVAIDGAYNTSKGVGAISFASVVPDPEDQLMRSQFESLARAHCDSMRVKNKSSLLMRDDVHILKKEYEENEQARISEWLYKTSHQTENATKDMQSFPDDMKDIIAEIPF